MNSRKDLGRQLEELAAPDGARRGKRYWQSLDELAGDENFQQLIKQEFPHQADIWPDSLSRRKFLTLMGASLALAGLSSCSVKPAPMHEIMPYVHPPENFVPGRPLFFATTMAIGGDAIGLLVESHLGRPTKIEGNPNHPASLGATGAWHQASVLTMYDPDRSQTVLHKRDVRSWDDAEQALRGMMAEQQKARGAGLRILTESVVSPTLSHQLTALLKDLPEAKWHQFEPVSSDTAHEAARLSFGQPVDAVYDFTKADIVVALDADFLGDYPGYVRYAHDFMSRRQLTSGADSAKSAEMNRLYLAETAVSCTGAKADHRLALPPGEIEQLARSLAVELGVLSAEHISGGKVSERRSKWIRAVASDLKKHRGRCLLLAGYRQSPTVHMLANAINDKLENVGHTVRYIEPVAAHGGGSMASFRVLVEDMQRGRVEALIILGGNPAYTSPADLDFARTLSKVPFKARLGLYFDETSELCDWHLPEAHYLEAWSDARAFDGTASLAQPLIEPLYGGRSAHEVVALLTGQPLRPGYEIVRDYWRSQWSSATLADPKTSGDESDNQQDTDATDASGTSQQEARDKGADEKPSLDADPATANGDKADQEPQSAAAKGDQNSDQEQEFEKTWQIAVHDGIIADSASASVSVTLNDDWHQKLTSARQDANSRAAEGTNQAQGKDSLELAIMPDPAIYDGRFANNGWLQELPKPITKLTWDNAILMSPATAERLGLGQGEFAHGGEHGGYDVPIVELHIGDRWIAGPVWVQPGHAEGAVSIQLGYGRRRAGRVGGDANHSVGFNAYALQTSAQRWSSPSVTIKRTGLTKPLACTQSLHSLGSRKEEIVRAGTLAEYRSDPSSIAHRHDEHQPATEKSAPRGGEQPAELPETLYAPFEYKPPVHKWGMAINMTTCTGCSACVVACQAENNIPVVGKDQVLAGREMHWLRIDRYVSGEPNEPAEFHFQPLLCMHCENAPCEYVCPVEATLHSAEGLNEMVYQRCVGTRFCSNNCPYKVRRFNFLAYSNIFAIQEKMQLNPDVTVRSRGVMEKCSYCVQRIRAADIDSQASGRKLADGDVLTACQAACPTQAIVFGDLNDPDAAVTKSKQSPLEYGLLTDLNTYPRTTYLAALRNPNPELEPS
jgi:molybdopterin-containing oxidoreductase family iron-sulfur binding subunit